MVAKKLKNIIMNIYSKEMLKKSLPRNNFFYFIISLGPIAVWYISGFFFLEQNKVKDILGFFCIIGLFPIISTMLFNKAEISIKTNKINFLILFQLIESLCILALVWAPLNILRIALPVTLILHLLLVFFLYISEDDIFRRLDSITFFIPALVSILPLFTLIDFLLFSPTIKQGIKSVFSGSSGWIGMSIGIAVSVSTLFFANGALKTRYKIPRTLNEVIFIATIIIALGLLVDTSLPYDSIHYATYVGPANDLLYGKFPLVSAFSQYGLINFSIYTFGLMAFAHSSPSVIATITILINACCYLCIFYICIKLSSNKFLGLLYALLILLVYSHITNFPMNSYPNFRGMRLLPIVFFTASFISIPANRLFTTISSISFSLAQLWSIEAAFCVFIAYFIYIILATQRRDFYRNIFLLFLLTIIPHLTLMVASLALSNSLPRYDVYIKFVFSFVNPSNYTGANWLASINPKELIWIPIILFYFVVLSLYWKYLINSKFNFLRSANNRFFLNILILLFISIISFVIFLFRPILVYLLIFSPFIYILLTSITFAVFSPQFNLNFSFKAAIGLPFVLLSSIAFGSLSNILFELDPNISITHDISALSKFTHEKNFGYKDWISKLNSSGSDFEILRGISFPWKAERIKETIYFVNKYFENINSAGILTPEAPNVLLLTRKGQKFPTSYSFSESASSEMNNYVSRIPLELKENDKVIISNYISELNTLEVRLLNNLLLSYNLIPVEAGKFVTVYYVSGKSNSVNKFIMPYKIRATETSSNLSALYSGAYASDISEVTYWSTPIKDEPTVETIILDIGEEKNIKRIVVVPYWPEVSAFPSTFSILSSVDGVYWTTIITENSFVPKWQNYSSIPLEGYKVDNLSIEARYIKMNLLTPLVTTQNRYFLQIADVLIY